MIGEALPIPRFRENKKIGVMDREKKSRGFIIGKTGWLPTNTAKPESSIPVWVSGVVTSPAIPKIYKEQIFAERQTAYKNVHKISEGSLL